MLLAIYLGYLIGIVSAEMTRKNKVLWQVMLSIGVGVAVAVTSTGVCGYILVLWLNQIYGSSTWLRLPLMDVLMFPVVVEAKFPAYRCPGYHYGVQVSLLSVTIFSGAVSCASFPVAYIQVLLPSIGTLFLLNLLPSLLLATLPTVLLISRDFIKRKRK